MAEPLSPAQRLWEVQLDVGDPAEWLNDRERGLLVVVLADSGPVTGLRVGDLPAVRVEAHRDERQAQTIICVRFGP